MVPTVTSNLSSSFFLQASNTSTYNYSTYHTTQVSLQYAILYMQADTVAST